MNLYVYPPTSQYYDWLGGRSISWVSYWSKKDRIDLKLPSHIVLAWRETQFCIIRAEQGRTKLQISYYNTFWQSPRESGMLLSNPALYSQ